ncbi:hypothetical protein QLQ12_00525 [Actinoplanes sp. NEAU-A12]|uniref:Uncharacterized protein n=1 Tax=Actinoplanes sandaracinus TaxID=3045177 RepID=A0ABT6WBI6_9ACTN|nr:hypothetical protein [Actinoplanes sandaracinus]MDI6097092.1 hypothetical protein [Actinoplanes sandaracinus]
MQALRGAGHRRGGGQRRALHRDLGRELSRAGGDPAEVDGRLGQTHRCTAQRGRRRGGDPALAGGDLPQRLPSLDRTRQVVAGRGDRELRDHCHLVTSRAADPGQPRLPPGPEHPLADARVTLTQVVVEFTDADPAVLVAVGGAARDAVGDQAGEGGRFGPCGGGDHDPALPLRGTRRAEMMAGVDRPTGPPVEQHHGLPGAAALHQRRHLGHVDGGVRRTAHHGVGGSQVEPSARPGQHHAPEVDEDTVLLITAFEQGLDRRIRLTRPGVTQERHLETTERLIPEHVRERRHIGRRHREPAQHGVVVLLDANHYCESSPVHRMHHPSSMVRCRGRS